MHRLSVEELYEIYLHHLEISTDSRKIIGGEIFFALSGEHFDGNTFASKAIENGAAYAVIDNPEYALSTQFLLVDDVYLSLVELAKLHRSKLNIPIIAVTGTNGKTTTKELLLSTLAKKYKVVATRGNFNNHIGVPLTLLSMSQTTEIGVVEMGANHPGEIAILCEIARPSHGLITNVGKAHLEGFGSFDGVIKTKRELYEYLVNHNGIVWINVDDKHLCSMLYEVTGEERSDDLHTYGYSTDQEIEYRACDISANPFLSFCWIIAESNEERYGIVSHLLGQFHWSNIMASVAVASFFQLSPRQICDAINSYVPLNNRSQVIESDNNKIFLDAYNANPSSMTAAVENFVRMEMDSKLLIIGEMLELGVAALKEHDDLLKLINDNRTHFDGIYIVGNQFQNQDYPFMFFEDTEALERFLSKEKLYKKNIYIKGSRKNHLETIVDYL